MVPLFPPYVENNMQFWINLREKWEQAGKPVPKGATLEELNTFEQRYSVSLPPSMRDYFTVINGSGEMLYDNFDFWPLQRVKLVSEELDGPLDYSHCFLFADYAIWCFGYAIKLTEDPHAEGPVYIVGGHEKIVVANTFLEFMQKYVADPQSVQ